MRVAFSVAVTLILALAGSPTPAEGSPEDPAACLTVQEAAPRYWTDESGTPILDDRVVVKLTAEVARGADALPEYGLPRGIPELDAVLERYGIRDGFRVIREHGTPIRDMDLFREIGLDRLYTFRLPRADRETVRRLVYEFKRQDWVEYAQPVYIGQATAVPDDSRFNEQWAHNNTGQTGGTPDADVDSPEAWDLGIGNSTGVVAILDTGAHQTHEDLVSNVIAGFDFANNDADPQDDNGHGTQASGIAAARGNNGVGVSGVCQQCSIMPLKVLDSGGGGNSNDLADAIRYAADNGADTISMSLAFGRSWIQEIIDAAAYAQGLGALPFASAGNGTGYFPRTPAAYPDIVSVGGTDDDDLRVYEYGDHAELSAPAPNTLSTSWVSDAVTDSYANFGGTSASCPHGAGLGALLRAEDNNLHVRELRHLIRLGADDQTGAPAEDTPGWDQFMGYGRMNSHGSLSLINGPWIALDRAHYVCAGDVVVSLKDKTAGSTVDVTLTGDIGGDSETVTVSPVTGDGYYEGSISISWAGKDGPVTIGDGTLDVEHGETITATVGALSTTAFLDCLKQVCYFPQVRNFVTGDCDADHSLDPGEVWSIGPALNNAQTEEMFDAVAVISTTSPNVEILSDTTTFGSIVPFDTKFHEEDGSDDPVRVRGLAGAPANGTATFSLAVSGRGWEADTSACPAPEFSLTLNRDLGAPTGTGWDFDDGTAQGFTSAVAHDTGDLSECEPLFTSWGNDWNPLPQTDRSHSGTHSMRLGNGTTYSSTLDAGLSSPAFTVPAGGGAIGFYTWMDSELAGTRFAWDGMVVEAKDTGGVTWNFQQGATYNTDQNAGGCSVIGGFPFGIAETVDMLAGDGAGSATTGDTFDVEQHVDLTGFAGQEIQVRLRFGSDSNTQGSGVWIDTVTLYGPYVADAWPGGAPSNLTGSETNCPTSFDLSWDAVPGAGGYNVYRSEVSCQDANSRTDIYGTSTTADFSDAGAVEDVEYFYAVEATEAGSGCPTERSCISGGCLSCTLPGDPANLRVDRDVDDVVLTWTDPGLGGITWNVYRDTNPDPATWGAPIATGVTDQDPGTAGIQWTDVGGVNAGSPLHYLVTAVDSCGESPLR